MMASMSPSPSIIIGCEYGSQKSFWTKKLSFNVNPKTAFPQVSIRTLNFSRKISRNLRVRATNLSHEGNRPLTVFPPSPWTDYFLSVRVEESDIDAILNEITALTPVVRDILLSPHRELKETIHFIYLLDTLCLSYHFEDDIESILKNVSDNIETKIANDEDLYTISIIFRVLRRHGYKISCDVFERFKGEDGKFKSDLVKDIEGMLSLYEAAHMGTTTEYIMDEALSFTMDHLESLAQLLSSPHLSRLIKNALYRPQHHNAELLVAREYISFYEQEDDHDKMLLKFAKLNFNYLQLQYIRELNIITKWWKDLNMASKLPYMRDRMVELYFWTTILYFEPEFSAGRITTSKFYAVFTSVDDTCDAYATLEEASTLVNNLERLDPDAIDELPGYLKIVFKFVLDVFKESEQKLSQEGKTYYMSNVKTQFRRTVRAFLEISKWARNGKVPTYEDYIEVAKVAGAASVSIAPCIMSMGPIADRETYEWLKSSPNLIDALDLKSRLTNDITTYKGELNRGEVATGINCYMKQYRVSEEEALAEFRRRLREVNKVVNEEFLNTKVVPRKILDRVVNLGRFLDVSYTYGDEFTHAEGKMKDNINALFVEPIPL